MKFLVRAFIKLTGIFPFLIVIKPKFYYESPKAKKDCKKKRKKGMIIVSNHTKIFDYYVFLYRYFFRIVHTFVAEIIYRNGFLKFLCNVLGNIKVERNNPSQLNAYNEANNYLKKNKMLLIFPEGKLENKDHKILDFKSSAIVLAYKNNVPIIPHFNDGNYGLFKRTRIIVGESIDLHQYIQKDELNNDDINYLTNIVKDKIIKLRHQLSCMRKFKTQEVFNSQCLMQTVLRFFHFPFGYLVFFTKKIFACDKKKLRKALKSKVIIAANHLGELDAICLYLSFQSRRLRVVSTEGLWRYEKYRFYMDHSGCIKYRRDSLDKFDIQCALDINEVLEGNGVVAIFPQGHLQHEKDFTNNIKGGTALFSLINNSPIIPFVFLNHYRPLRINRVVIGDPIYPSDCFPEGYQINRNVIETYSNFIYNKMNSLLHLDYGKKRNLQQTSRRDKEIVS